METFFQIKKEAHGELQYTWMSLISGLIKKKTHTEPFTSQVNEVHE